jgi:hypothetical protein
MGESFWRRLGREVTRVPNPREVKAQVYRLEDGGVRIELSHPYATVRGDMTPVEAWRFAHRILDAAKRSE